LVFPRHYHFSLLLKGRLGIAPLGGLRPLLTADVLFVPIAALFLQGVPRSAPHLSDEKS
jgi:hypothetical protein